MYVLLKVCSPEVRIKECQVVMKNLSCVMNTRFLSQNLLSCSAVFLSQIALSENRQCDTALNSWGNDVNLYRVIES